MKIRSLLAIVTLSVSSIAIADDSYIPGQFIISNPIEVLQAKTVDAVEEASGSQVAVTDITQAGIKIESHEAYSLGIKQATDEDLCLKLRKKERQRKARGEFTRPLARYCERNYILQASVVPNDPYFSGSMWGLQRLSMQTVWDKSTGSSMNVVAVIDTGVDYQHPDLQGNLWINPKEIAGNGIDDDQNGYVDDIYGANFIDGSGNPMDDNGHGTHVSGTIGARTNNGSGVSGINWNVKIMALKFLGSNGSGSLWGAVNALTYARAMKEKGVNVVLSNNSWGGGGYYVSLYDEIKRWKDAGMLFVAAAGNSTINSDVSPQYPASYELDNVLSVAALDSNGSLASYSNYGATTVDIAAPGSSIASTYPGNKYTYLSGTSMACPHVSGAAALLKAYSASLTATQIKDAILNSAIPNAAVAGKVLTNGELNINGAMALVPNNPLIPGTPTPTPTATNTPLPSPTPTATPIPATPTPTQTPAPGNWTLRVLSEAGTGLGQVGVTVTGPGNYFSAGYTLNDGTLSLSNLVGGAYTAQFVKAGYAFQPATLQFTVNGNTVSVVSGLKSTYLISGTVMNRLDAAPLANATIDVIVNGSRVNTLTTGSDGRFSTQIAYKDSYRLEVREDGYYPHDLTGVVTGKATRVAALMPN